MKTFSRGLLYRRLRNAVFRFIRVVAAPIVNKEIAKAASGFTFKMPVNGTITETLPTKRTDAATVVKQVLALHNELDEDYLKGGLSGTVYHGGPEFTEHIHRGGEVMGDVRVGDVEHVNDEVGDHHLLERGLERLDQAVRQPANEADRVCH